MIFTMPNSSRFWCRCKTALLRRIFIYKVTILSLCYNDFLDMHYVLDVCLEPLFWFVDHFTKIMGPIFVAMVQFLTFSVVAIAYIIGVPYWIQHSIIITIIAFIIGHWLLINVLFHYYMAYVTKPGFPPEGSLIPEAVSICKKCIAPKPPRTHHCSICNKCILKMDHHCPWIDNCIGNFNHRYFFMYCVYMWLGVNFVMLLGFNIFREHFFTDVPDLKSNVSDPEVIEETYYTIFDRQGSYYHTCIVYAMLMCIGVCGVLGALIAWHGRLITNGETSIEGHINKKERAKFKTEGRIYKNPYNFGPRTNWKLFLGLTKERGWKCVLFPSSHLPSSDGLRWHTKKCEHLVLLNQKRGIT